MRSERDIEQAAGDRLGRWAAEIGMEILYIKITPLGLRGLPDRLILWPMSNLLFVEWKLPGEEPTPIQKYMHKVLRRIGWEVEVHDNVDRFMESIKAKVGATRLPKEGS